jgi:hypothetical protein
MLGIAQLKAGHKDDASKTFKAVKGEAALERLANLWNLRAKQGNATNVSQTQNAKGSKVSQSQKAARARVRQS